MDLGIAVHLLESRSSVGFDPRSGSVTSALTPNSRALIVTKQPFSGEIVRFCWFSGEALVLSRCPA